MSSRTTILRAVPLLALAASQCGCQSIAVALAPVKRPAAATDETSTRVKAEFWRTFRAGEYERIDDLLRQLTGAYLDAPRDPDLPLLLALTHAWRAAERGRVSPDPRVTDSLVLTAHYLEDAQVLRPEDPRLSTWLGVTNLALATISQDDRALRRAYFQTVDGVDKLPQFNGFTAASAHVMMPRSDARSAKALEYLLEAFDACGVHVDPAAPEDAKRRLRAFAQTPPRMSEVNQRNCANSFKAPHNFEAGLLDLGDVAGRVGNLPLAKAAYESASASASYATWKYRAKVEDRLASLDERARTYAAGREPETYPTSSYFCTGCHAE